MRKEKDANAKPLFDALAEKGLTIRGLAEVMDTPATLRSRIRALEKHRAGTRKLSLNLALWLHRRGREVDPDFQELSELLTQEDR